MPGVSTKTDLALRVVLDAEDARAGGLGLIGDDGELVADDAVQQRRLSRVRAADQRNEPGLHVYSLAFPISPARARARDAGDADFPHAPPLGVDHLHVKAVDVERLADRRHMSEMAQQESADGLEPFALDRHVKPVGDFVDVGGAAEHKRSVAFVDDRLGLDVVFVADLADDLFDEILERDEPCRAAVFVHDDGALDALVLELAQQLADELGFRARNAPAAGDS